MEDLTTDAAPLGNPPAPALQEAARPRTSRHRTPLVYNITDSKDVHIGPVFHNVMPRPRPRPAPQDMPRQQDLEALLRCSREIEERDKLVVSEHLGSKWKSLARHMGLSAGQIDNLEADHPRSVDRAYELLDTWHDMRAQEATVSTLTDLLQKVKANSAIKRLKP